MNVGETISISAWLQSVEHRLAQKGSSRQEAGDILQESGNSITYGQIAQMQDLDKWFFEMRFFGGFEKRFTGLLVFNIVSEGHRGRDDRT